MDFHPAFHLLLKFTVGLRTEPPSADDVLIVAKYLGIDMPTATLDAQISLIQQELQRQNAYLSKHLETDAVYGSELFSRSEFVKQIVENNRINRRNRTIRTTE